MPNISALLIFVQEGQRFPIITEHPYHVHHNQYDLQLPSKNIQFSAFLNKDRYRKGQSNIDSGWILTAKWLDFA